MGNAVCVALATGLLLYTAKAETLTPSSVEYDIEAKHDKIAASCTIMLTVLNYPISPEALNFRAGVWRGTDPATRPAGTFAGFTLDVGNLLFENGVITGTQKTPLARAAFGSTKFNSVGRLYEADMGDGGRGANTVDPQTALDFMTAVFEGNFDIAFTAKDLPLQRTYHISDAPPASIVQRFHECMGAL